MCSTISNNTYNQVLKSYNKPNSTNGGGHNKTLRAKTVPVFAILLSHE